MIRRYGGRNLLQTFYKLAEKEPQQRWIHAAPVQQGNLESLKDRGILQQVLPPTEISRLVYHVRRSGSVYCGIDPTSDSLHVGNLLTILLLIRLQKEGLIPIVLLGDVTAYIGDPSGHTTSRSPLSEQDIQNNCARIENTLMEIFDNYRTYFSDNVSHPELRLIRNSYWYQNINVVDFLSTVGRYFRLEKMLDREFVQQRLTNSTGMNLAEFKYEMFQAYDWCKLFETYGCRIQIGGQDQVDNIRTGRDLIKRFHEEESVGLITPLVTNECGDKYGKSGGSPVWLSSNKTSAYDLYQFFLRMADAEALRLVPMFTFVCDEELRDLFKGHEVNPDERLCQKRLARDLTMLVHGKKGLDLALKATELFFGSKSDVIYELSKEDFEQIFATVACVDLPHDAMSDSNMDLISLSMLAKLFPTERDAKRIIDAGGLYLNMKRVYTIPRNVVLPAGFTLARVGKKNYTLIKWL